METRGGRNRDRQPPPLSLGLSSVRLIVDRLEANYTRVVAAHKDDRVDQQIVRYDPNVDGDYTDSDFLLKQSSSRVFCRFLVNLGIALSQCIPRVSYGNFGALAVGAGLVAPRMFTYFVVYPFCRLVFGTLYPAYASYKAVRTKNLKEYVKWMMYWIVFALFTCTETFTDVFLSWFPFYYEVKIVIVLWLLSPATKGSSILYRKFVHPALCRRETEIDEYIAKAKDQGYHTVLNLGTKGVNYATTVIMQTAIKGGGGLVQQIRKSYSLSDLSECDAIDDRARDEADDVMCEPQAMRRSVVRSGYNTRRSASESNSRGAMYFPEVDVELRSRSARIEEVDISSIKSSEDISSGYSSADNSGGSLTRTASVGAPAKSRARQGRTITSIKRPQAAEDSGVIIEELQDDEQFEFSSLPPLENLSSPLFLSHTNPPFIYQYVGDQVKIIQVLGAPLGSDKKDNSIRDQKITSQDDLTILSTNDERNVFNDEVVEDVFENVTNSSEVDNMAGNNALKPDKTIETKLNTEKITEENKKDISDDCKKDEEIKPVSITKKSPEMVGQKDKPIDFIETELKTDAVKPVLIPNDETQKIEQKYALIDTVVIKDSAADKKIDRTIDDDSPASDDEASFGTPDDSPKTKRKSPKGKYGKAKAPPPPKLNLDESKEDAQSINPSITTSQESLLDLINALPNLSLNEPNSSKSSQIVNPIAEIKRRHKSKSPRKTSRSNSSTIGKLLQIPGKLAFWNKGDKTKSEKSLSSGEESRRSSTIERSNDEFDGHLDENIKATSLNIGLNLHTDITISDIMEKSDDQISFKDASDFETENVVTQDILEKSDVLQKLIDAKIVSHPEYKFIPLKGHENLEEPALENTADNQTTEMEDIKPSISSDV